VIIAAVAAAAVVAVVIGIWLFRRRRSSSTGHVTRAGGDLGAGLAPTRRAMRDRLGVLLGRELDPAGLGDLERVLLAADIGPGVTAGIIGALHDQRPAGPDEAAAALRRLLVESFRDVPRDLHLAGDPAVIVMVGVNGSGKTTTAAKLGARLAGGGSGVLLGAADTFRAAAAEQLRSWGERLDVDTVSGQPGADPASVAFDAYRAAAARGKDVLIVDTAGRLHAKQNLMDELAKIVRVLGREGGEVGEVLLVLDGTGGQNGIAQARAFTEAVGVTGLVVTKLDGTARGGIAIAVERELGVPVKYVGVGEGPDDLLPFEVDAFVEALLGV
jgi:fused signal recognition particle receptor